MTPAKMLTAHEHLIQAIEMRRAQTGGGGAFAASALIYRRNAIATSDCMSENAHTYTHSQKESALCMGFRVAGFCPNAWLGQKTSERASEREKLLLRAANNYHTYVTPAAKILKWLWRRTPAA
jgi:hypothetical protein